ncbi:MAG TPA: hypothetical protein VHP31_09215 [Caproicibacter sp.]|nr:hypothetical protein [Caproicibacter sp.]
MKQKIKNSLHPKKPRGIKKIVGESKEILRSTNRLSRFSSMCILSMSFMILGLLIASLLGNVFLMPVLAIGLSLIPFLYVLLASFGFKKRLNRELETSLYIITMDYIQSENLIKAVQDNIDHFHAPVKKIFQKFITQVTMINSNVTQELLNIRESIDNDNFHEWIDAVISCQTNRNLKNTLMPIVNKFSDIRIVSGEVNLELYDPFKDFILTALFLVVEPVFIWSQNADWYDILMHTMAGQIILAIDAVAFFGCLIREIRLTRPIEYKR